MSRSTTVHRAAIDGAIKRTLRPALRSRGFTGSGLHLRREREGAIDLLTIQFSRYGGEFVVELVRAPSDGIVTAQGKVVSPEKLTSQYFARRLRLGAPGPSEDHWFKFESFDADRDPDAYDRLMIEVIQRLDDQGEAWWKAAVPEVPMSKSPTP